MAYKKNRENEIKEEDKSTRDQVNRLFLKVTNPFGEERKEKQRLLNRKYL